MEHPKRKINPYAPKAVEGGGPRLPKVEHMEVPALAISSSDIRDRVAAGRPVRYLLPESVSAYIEKTGLYRAPTR